MLSNSGFAPEWIGLDKEIRTSMEKLKADIETAWNKCGPLPMDLEQLKHWEQQLMEFEEAVNVINKKIFDLNLIVPSLTSQRSHLRYWRSCWSKLWRSHSLDRALRQWRSSRMRVKCMDPLRTLLATG